MVLETLFLQVQPTLMLVYFNPSFQGITFLFGTSFMEYSYMFICCVTNPIGVDPHSKCTSIEDVNPVKDNNQTGASILYTLRWHLHFIFVTNLVPVNRHCSIPGNETLCWVVQFQVDWVNSHCPHCTLKVLNIGHVNYWGSLGWDHWMLLVSFRSTDSKVCLQPGFFLALDNSTGALVQPPQSLKSIYPNT